MTPLPGLFSSRDRRDIVANAQWRHAYMMFLFGGRSDVLLLRPGNAVIDWPILSRRHRLLRIRVSCPFPI